MKARSRKVPVDPDVKHVQKGNILEGKTHPVVWLALPDFSMKFSVPLYVRPAYPEHLASMVQKSVLHVMQVLLVVMEIVSAVHLVESMIK